MRAARRWAGWAWERHNGHWSKVPKDPRTGGNASSTDPATWSDFDTALRWYAGGGADGPLFMLGDGWLGIDTDESVFEDAGGEVRHSALLADILTAVVTYAEYSPTFTGAKLFGRGDIAAALAAAGKKTGFNRRDLGLEVYHAARPFAVTGWRVGNAPEGVSDVSAAAAALVAAYAGRAAREGAEPPPAPAPLAIPDAELLERMFRSKPGGRIRTLFGGDWAGAGCGSHSEGDAALLSYLVWWCGRDEAAADRLFRSSALCRPKWTERADYRTRTFELAQRFPGEGYRPRGRLMFLRAYTPLGADERPPPGAPAADPGPPADAEGSDGSDPGRDAATGSAPPPPDAGDPAPPPPGPGDGPPVNAHDDDPARLGRLFLGRRYAHEHRGRLCYHQGGFLEWVGGRWKAKPDGIREEVRLAVEDEFEAIHRRELAAWAKAGGADGEGRAKAPPKKRRVTNTLVLNVVGHVEAVTLLPWETDPPVWLAAGPPPAPPEHLVATAQGVIHLPALAAGRADYLTPATPHLFTRVALPFLVDAGPAGPVAWLRFLGSVWPADPESVEALRLWFGYALTLDTSQQKALFLVGPKRAGKGTILKVLRELVGQDNAVGLEIAQLGAEFGLEPLVGKALAVAADARLSDRTPADQRIIDRLLTITGEDHVSVNRKNQKQISARLRVKFVFASNELPTLRDASGALVGRFTVLRLTESFADNPDTGLFEGKLRPELPAIFRWAVGGWQALQRAGRLLQPASALPLIRQLEDLASPVAKFVRDWCEVGPDLEVPKDDLYARFQQWCQRQGIRPAPDHISFSKDLFAAYPGTVSPARPRVGGKRLQVYSGIAACR